MKRVPYEPNRGSSCALSCYTMAARYLLSDQNITFEKLAKITGYHKGYVVWGGTVWAWMMEQGIFITDHDIIDYEDIAQSGLSGLEESVSAKDFEYYKKNTFNLEKSMKEMVSAYQHPNFKYIKGAVSWEDIEQNFAKPGICDVTLDMDIIDKGRSGGHRVILLDITDTEVVFHDPNKAGNGAHRRAPKHLFQQALVNLGDVELCHYSLSS